MWEGAMYLIVYCILSLKCVKFYINHIVTLLHLLTNLSLYNQRKQRPEFDHCYCVLCALGLGQSKNVPYIKTKLEHQTSAWLTWVSREGGRGKMAKTEPPGRASVAAQYESLFCFCAPAKLVTETSELQGQLCIILWMLVWDTTVLEYSLTFACAQVFPISKPGVILCGVRVKQQKMRALTKAGLCGNTVLCMSDMIQSLSLIFYAELRNSEALATAVACC